MRCNIPFILDSFLARERAAEYSGLADLFVQVDTAVGMHTRARAAGMTGFRIHSIHTDIISQWISDQLRPASQRDFWRQRVDADQIARSSHQEDYLTAGVATIVFELIEDDETHMQFIYNLGYGYRGVERTNNLAWADVTKDAINAWGIVTNRLDSVCILAGIDL